MHVIQCIRYIIYYSISKPHAPLAYIFIGLEYKRPPHPPSTQVGDAISDVRGPQHPILVRDSVEPFLKRWGRLVRPILPSASVGDGIHSAMRVWEGSHSSLDKTRSNYMLCSRYIVLVYIEYITLSIQYYTYNISVVTCYTTYNSFIEWRGALPQAMRRLAPPHPPIDRCGRWHAFCDVMYGRASIPLSTIRARFMCYIPDA